MISVKNLEKRYGDVRAVKDVSFEVAQGDIVGLLGQNGAGKTTVMKVLTGYLEPTAGTVTVGGVDVTQDRLAVQRQIGYLPENAPLYPEMLVQEYLLMMAELRGIPAGDRVAAVLDAVRAISLEPYIVRPIAQLSKGFRQRVGLAGAILHKPPVLVLDEPTNGLDPVQIVEIRNLIRRLAETATVILSTHILSEIEAVCNRVVVLIDGHLATDQPLTELLASREVRLSVGQGAKDVLGRLRGVEGVAGAERVGHDPAAEGYELWRVDCGEAPAEVVGRIISTGTEEGWQIGSVAAQIPSLESVFRNLMDVHVAERREQAQAS